MEDVDSEKTHCERPQRYEQIQVRDDLENPRSRSFTSSLEGDIVPNALLKSSCSRRDACLLPIPVRISFVSFSNADCMQWCFLKFTWKGSRMLAFLRYATIWSWASFSRTLERKQRRAMGRNSDEDEGVDTFLSAIRRAVFHDDVNTPRASDTSNNQMREYHRQCLSHYRMRNPILTPCMQLKVCNCS